MDASESRTWKNGQVIDPTPEEIRERCEKIRAAWSPDETLKRAAWSHNVARIPSARLGEYD